MIMEPKSLKEDIISYLQVLLDDVTLEDIMYYLYVKEKILNGLKDAESGNTVSNEKAKEIIDQWQQ